MVSIDLDNIIHYHPPPIPKPPRKLPHLNTSSHGSSHPPLNHPILIHPLPPRPPCFSHESPQTCHPRRQSPPPAVSYFPPDRDADLNEFDRELANLEMAELGSQETPGLCFGGSEETQAENTNDTQRKELHDQHGASHNNDCYKEDLRLLSEDSATPQDNATSSNTTETDLSSAASAPTSPVEADGSVSPKEPCPIHNPSSTEGRDTQLSLFGCEAEVDSMAVGESSHRLTSQHDGNVSSDQPRLPSPRTPGDESEPGNQRLSRWSSDTSTEAGKSSLPAIMEANSIQLCTQDLSATHDSHLGVQSEGDEVLSTDCCLGDEVLLNPISPVSQKQDQAVSSSEGNAPQRDFSGSSSVSVVVPVSRSHGLPITRSTRAGQTSCTGKRKSRAKSPCHVDSDDPDDGDYSDENDSGIRDIPALPRLTKRQRRTATMKTQPVQARRESPPCVFSSPGPEEGIANPCPATTLQDIQTIPVRGFLTRQIFLSRVIYSCTFEEDRQHFCPHGPTKAPECDESLDKTGHTKRPSNKKPSAHASRFLPAEDELLIELKEKRSLPWNRIVKHFPGRTKGALQVRYSTKLKDRGTGSPRRGRSGRVTCPAATAAASRG
ncbi:hypothetical protein PDE_03981 [Penicillium oxalicum 114-2]|uniref:Myb-like domain-containing protein n=1 Tax=Penicillium oxalicum (strain 114-2 / CGMCC 5302) TaxID=933388 RepID=S7ZEE6_PENO1|nr:hypothetical protein PDE_03981 [Penicillium oxalicum 114-2]